MAKAKWSVRSGQKYDKDRRFVQHSDKAGHTSEIRLRLPPQMAAQIGEIVASKVIEDYLRPTDFVADAVYHHLERIGREIDSGEIQRMLTVHVMLSDAQRRKIERESFEELIETVNQNAQVFYSSRTKEAQSERLLEYMDELIDAVGAIPPEHRSDYLFMIEEHRKATQRWQ